MRVPMAAHTEPQTNPFLTGAGLFPSLMIELNLGCDFMEVLINWRKSDGLWM